MSVLTFLRLFLALTKLISTWIDKSQLDAAEQRGEDLGEVKAYLAWSKEIDERNKAAAAAGDDVESGRVQLDPNDPNRRD